MSHAEELFTVPAWVHSIKKGFEAFSEGGKAKNKCENKKKEHNREKTTEIGENREFSTVRSPTEDTMKTALNRHLEGRYVYYWVLNVKYLRFLFKINSYSVKPDVLWPS